MLKHKVNRVIEETVMEAKPARAPWTTKELRFDLTGMAPALFGNELRLEAPALMFTGPVLDTYAFEVMKAAGLDEREIEEAIDDMVAGLQTRILAKMLMKRRMG
jgi:hypothetical protein